MTMWMLAQVDRVQQSFGHVDHLKALEICVSNMMQEVLEG